MKERKKEGEEWKQKWRGAKGSIGEKKKKKRKNELSLTTTSSIISIVSTYLSASLCVRRALALTLHSRQIPDTLRKGEDIEVEVEVGV